MVWYCFDLCRGCLFHLAIFVIFPKDYFGQYHPKPEKTRFHILFLRGNDTFIQNNHNLKFLLEHWELLSPLHDNL